MLLAIITALSLFPGPMTPVQSGQVVIVVVDTVLHRKNPDVALGLSFLNTAAPVIIASAIGKDPDAGSRSLAFLAYGLIVGPAAGHIYAGNGGHAMGGILIRTASAGAFVGGFYLAMGAAFDSEYDPGPWPGALLLGGMIIGGASIFYDVFSAPRSAHLWNDAHGGLSLKFTPALDLTNRQVGLILKATL